MLSRQCGSVGARSCVITLRGGEERVGVRSVRKHDASVISEGVILDTGRIIHHVFGVFVCGFLAYNGNARSATMARRRYCLHALMNAVEGSRVVVRF